MGFVKKAAGAGLFGLTGLVANSIFGKKNKDKPQQSLATSSSAPVTAPPPNSLISDKTLY